MNLSLSKAHFFWYQCSFWNFFLSFLTFRSLVELICDLLWRNLQFRHTFAFQTDKNNSIIVNTCLIIRIHGLFCLYVCNSSLHKLYYISVYGERTNSLFSSNRDTQFWNVHIKIYLYQRSFRSKGKIHVEKIKSWINAHLSILNFFQSFR